MGSSQTTTQNNTPYAPAQPMIDQGLQQAQQLYNAGGFQVNPYQGQLVADYDPMRAQADAMTPGMAQGAIDRTNAAYGAVSSAMDPSQWMAGLDGVRDNVIADVMPAVNSTFAMNGRTGGGLHQQNLAKGLSAGIADAYYGAYNRAQDRSLGAAGMVPGLNQAQFGAADYLRGAGTDRQAYDQSVIAGDVMRDQQAQMAEMQALQDYMALSTGAGSMFGIQSSTSRNNPGLLGVLGAGLQGAGLFF